MIERSSPVRHLAWLLGVLGALAACSSGGPSPDVLPAGNTVASTTPEPGSSPDGAAPQSSATPVSPGTVPEPSTPADPTNVPASGVAGASVSTCWTAEPGGDTGISFEDATREFAAVDPLTGMHPHAAAAGDVDNDGWIDLFVGTFADRDADTYRIRGAQGPAPDRILLGGPDGFSVDETFPDDRGRSSGATFADLDGDGDDDLVVSRNQRGSDGIRGRPTVVYENDDDGWTERLTLAPGVGARSIAAADLDRDGVLDLIIAGDRYGDGSTTAYRGRGDFSFDDATSHWGVPDDLTGLALAIVDLDDDGWLDVVVNGDERVLRGSATGFDVTRVPELEWETFGEEDDPAGIAIGDLDGNDLPDLVLGQHFNSTIDFDERVPVRILLNRSDSAGIALSDVTDSSGSPGLWTKSPHVAIVDVDNDGLNDIITSAATSSGAPFVLRQERSSDGTVQFESIGERGNGDYFVTGVADDFDRDGRVDSLLLAWEPERASLLALNTSASGDWIEVDPDGFDATQVFVSDPTTGEVLARAWSESTTGYASGRSDVFHFGLGDAPSELTVRLVADEAEQVATVQVNSRLSFGRC